MGRGKSIGKQLSRHKEHSAESALQTLVQRASLQPTDPQSSESASPAHYSFVSSQLIVPGWAQTDT